MTFKFVIDGKKRIERNIEEIVDVEEKISLGVASGMDIGHCFYIASRHCKTTNGFLNDVNSYRICDKSEALDPKCTTTIEFYK